MVLERSHAAQQYARRAACANFGGLAELRTGRFDFPEGKAATHSWKQRARPVGPSRRRATCRTACIHSDAAGR